MNLCTMFRILFSTFLLCSLLWGQNYRWPIRASQSLSATFSEYRSGHLHAGIDIKTWGEMEVPCIAIANGYIEQIVVGYRGYGRGLWLRLDDGNIAVYGHLEQFNPVIESLIRAEQSQRDRYSMRLKFSPNEYPVKAGQIIGYSGTSGTEHPHLHFEIRDTLGYVHNPQLFYSGIMDTKAPILDEILLLPVGPESQINDSHFPVVLDMQDEGIKVSTTGPFQIALNTHDRANGTYNKYNIYSAKALVNDSLIFSREFDQVAMRLTDDLEKVYPGVKGRRGWRFMSMFNNNLEEPAPFVDESQTGIISPAGLSHLKVVVADQEGNEVIKSLIFHETVPASWTVKSEGDTYIITRNYSDDGYENIQFYTGNNSYIPITETLYRMNSTTWVLGDKDLSSGVRALGSSGGNIKWIIPPVNQAIPVLNHNWRRKGAGYVLGVESKDPYVFPLAYALDGSKNQLLGELTQTTPTSVESDIIPLEWAALADSIGFLSGSVQVFSHPLSPMDLLPGGKNQTFSLDIIGAELSVRNTGNSDLYLNIDTVSATYDNRPIVGININLLETQNGQFSSTLSFSPHQLDSTLAIFSPGKKEVWERHISPDSSEQFEIDIQESGSFFLLRDDSPPSISPIKPYAFVRRGERLVFNIKDNTGVIDYPRSGIRATLDGALFFPDFNPLRDELSFHIPTRLGSGQHILEFAIEDKSGNLKEYKLTFSVKS